MSTSDHEEKIKVVNQTTRLTIIEDIFSNLQRGLFTDNKEFLQMKLEILQEHWDQFNEIHDELITSSTAKFLKNSYILEDVFKHSPRLDTQCFCKYAYFKRRNLQLLLHH